VQLQILKPKTQAFALGHKLNVFQITKAALMSGLF
jgi:hypothetical protein